MQLKRLREVQDTIQWSADTSDLPVINWESCASSRPAVPIRD
jgi:hypothetical protein